MNQNDNQEENEKVQHVKSTVNKSPQRSPRVGDAVWFKDDIGVRRNDQIIKIDGKQITGKVYDLTGKDFTIITAEFSY